MNQPTLQTCRAQQAHHLDLSLHSGLPNVRRIAELAAIAWGKEAGAAQKREDRAERTRILRESGNLLQIAVPLDERSLSENPDRGFPDDDDDFEC